MTENLQPNESNLPEEANSEPPTNASAPTETAETNQAQEGSVESVGEDQEPVVEAQLVEGESEVMVAELADPSEPPIDAATYARKPAEPPSVPAQFQNLSAKGGAVASLVLGLMAIIGISFSSLSLLNALLGLTLGLWGLTSNSPWISQIGIGLSLITVVLAAFVFNGITW